MKNKIFITLLMSVFTGGNATMNIESPAFKHNELIPLKYTCDGESISPKLTIKGVPPGTKSLALIVNDPDAPIGNVIHWVAWGIPADTTELPENAKTAGKGNNTRGKVGYMGPCPPTGTHRYYFTVYALDTELNLPEGTTADALMKAIHGHILAEAELIGLYHH
jgi:Raf kinase inhibitor-like YbhB/YbcL family protein